EDDVVRIDANGRACLGAAGDEDLVALDLDRLDGNGRSRRSRRATRLAARCRSRRGGYGPAAAPFPGGRLAARRSCAAGGSRRFRLVLGGPFFGGFFLGRLDRRILPGGGGCTARRRTGRRLAARRDPVGLRARLGRLGDGDQLA